MLLYRETDVVKNGLEVVNREGEIWYLEGVGLRNGEQFCYAHSPYVLYCVIMQWNETGA